MVVCGVFDGAVDCSCVWVVVMKKYLNLFVLILLRLWRSLSVSWDGEWIMKLNELVVTDVDKCTEL